MPSANVIWLQAVADGEAEAVGASGDQLRAELYIYTYIFIYIYVYTYIYKLLTHHCFAGGCRWRG